MTQAALLQSHAPVSGSSLPLGRTFVGPWFDTLLIGGGLSVIAALGLKAFGISAEMGIGYAALPVFILLSNSAHFAASTVRLYTKPGALRDLPFLTMGFPLVTVAVLTLAIVFAQYVGKHLNALYLTWSPYHYAAQAYGLAVMYCYRSGCNLGASEKKLMRWTCMLPFLWAFVKGSNSGLGWFVPASFYESLPAARWAVAALASLLAVMTFVAPGLLFWKLRRASGLTMPLISVLLIATNGLWWIAFSYIDAFIWATVFHGVQYLAIVTIFHVKERTRVASNRRGWLHHTLIFYLTCVGVGYALFHLWPRAYVLAGFGLAESMLLVAAVINLHHFIVDGYIWRLRKDRNYEIVNESAAATGSVGS